MDGTETSRKEDELLTLVTELKAQKEEAELMQGLRGDSYSYFYLPKDPGYFAKEFKLELKRQLNFPAEKHSKILSEVISSLLETCEKMDYNDKSLPYLVNQYFMNRIETLVNMKHSLMLRWKRYCITDDLQCCIEKEYLERLKIIDKEYSYLLDRVHKLEILKEDYIYKSDHGIDEILTEDLLLYLKGLSVHFYSMRYMSQILKILHWIAIKYRKKKPESKFDYEDALKSEKSSKIYASSENSSRSDYINANSAKPSLLVFLKLITEPVLAGHGGGVAIDENNLRMPLHTINVQNFVHILTNLCTVYSINANIKNLRSSAEEIELFSLISKKFKKLFIKQEKMRTFRVYDKMDGATNKCHNAMLKPATWTNHNPFKPKINLRAYKFLNYIRSKNFIDEFLRQASTFSKISNCEETQKNLKHQALLIQHLPVVHNTSVMANPNGYPIADLFKLFYNKMEVQIKTFSSDENKSKNDHNQDEYNFSETIQMLGLDESVERKDDASSVQGAYLSYLYLRFLKIRDLQRTCLSIFNYFRSLERTLVINTYGFSNCEIPKINKLYEETDEVNFNQNLGSHYYLFDNIDDFKIQESEFMKFTGIRNHDDFYFHEEGRIHVKDRMNYWIVYDIAVKDLEELEEELLSIGSYFIAIDKDLRKTTLFNRKNTQAKNDASTFLTEYGHREVDRFGVLYDLWNQHTEFMEKKKMLVDIYMEVYNSISSKEDRMNISQILCDLFYQKPRFDFSMHYFITSYRLESQILNIEYGIIQKLLDHEKDRYRNYMLTEYNSDDSDYNLIEKLLIYPNTDKSTLKPLYFLEFIPSLGMISEVKRAMEFAFANVKTHLDNVNIDTELKKNCEFLKFIDNEILENDIFSGNIYSNEIFNPLFSLSILDNPRNLIKVGESYMKNIESKNTRGEKRSIKIKLLKEFGRIFDLITVRFRLIDILYECKYLTTIYTTQALNMGYSEYHAYMRCIQFEEAKMKESAEVQIPYLYISSVQDDDTMVDKYEPEEYDLAIHELDSVHLGKFRLSDQRSIIELLLTKGLEDFQLTLKMQYCHTCALFAAVLLCDMCRPSIYSLVDIVEINNKRGITETATTIVPLSLQSGPTPLALDKQRTSELARHDLYAEAFFSIQLEKTPIRDRMLNNFIKKYTYTSKLSSLELEKAKRENIGYFIKSFFERISNYALKAQIISCYNSIINILKPFPDISETFFQFGQIIKPGNNVVEIESDNDKKQYFLRNRYRKVISDDGKLLNIWYIPHFTEILYLHRENNNSQVNDVLKNFLRLVQAFCDILHYIIGIWSLSLSNIRVSDKLKTEVRKENELPQENNFFNIVHHLHPEQKNSINVLLDYECTNKNQLEKEFLDFDSQMQNLKDPTNIDEVIEFLNFRRNYHYLTFDAFVTTILPDFLIASKNIDVYNQLNLGMESSAILLKKKENISNNYQDFNIPMPFLVREKVAKKWFSWRSILKAEGPFLHHFETWINILENIQLCFVAISKKHKHLLKDQFYCFNILIEEIILQESVKIPTIEKEITLKNDVFLLSKKFHKLDKKEKKSFIYSSENEEGILDKRTQHNFSYIYYPKETYAFLINYFLNFKKLNLLQQIYCSKRIKMTFSSIVEQYMANSRLIRREIVFPQLRKMSNELKFPYFYYFGPNLDDDIVVYPKGISTSFVNEKLTEILKAEILKINLTEKGKYIKLRLDKVIKERNFDGKEDDAIYYSVLKKTYLAPNLSFDVTKRIELPLLDDLFKNEKKKVDIKENEETNFEIEREIEENHLFTKEAPIELITFSKRHLNQCLQYLGNSVQRIQKEAFENYSMYFENITKQQQQLLKEKDNIIKELKEQFLKKDQSVTVQKKFILAQCAVNLIIEINYLRDQLNRDMEEDYNMNSTVRNENILDFKVIIRNIYALSFEQLTQMKIGLKSLSKNVFEKITAARVEAFNEMSKLKEKNGTKMTADDELMSRNVSLIQNLNINKQANSELEMLMLKMKSLFNWIYMYTFNTNDKKIKLYIDDSKKHKIVSFVTKQITEQEIIVLKCEIKQLKEMVIVSNADLVCLKNTLYSEIHEKSSKSKNEEINALKLKQNLKNKRIQIKNMLELINAANAKMTSMQKLLNDHLSIKETTAMKSNEEVHKLKKILIKEHGLKEKAFLKVNDLIAQVYEFEASYAVINNKILPTTKHQSSIEYLSKPKNPTAKPGHPTLNLNYPPPRKGLPRLTYKHLVNQHCQPYTSCHYLPFRRDKLYLNSIRTKIKNKLRSEMDNKYFSYINRPKLKKLSSSQLFKK